MHPRCTSGCTLKNRGHSIRVHFLIDKGLHAYTLDTMATEWHAASDQNPLAGYVDLVEAARIAGIHSHSLRRLLKQGLTPPPLLVAGKYLWEREVFERWASTYDNRPGRKVQPHAGS